MRRVSFSPYKRNNPRKPGRKLASYYARFVDDLGNRLADVSTGEKTKLSANDWAERKRREFEASSETRKTIPTISTFAAGFFANKGPYARDKLAAGMWSQ